jgi:hypothetical protein
MNKTIRELLDLLSLPVKAIGTLLPRRTRETPQKKARPASRQNHGKGESKVRRKMADKSRKINRKRR